MILGFVKYFRICEKLLGEPTIVLRFVIVYVRFYKLFNNDFQKKKSILFFGDIEKYFVIVHCRLF